MYTELPSNSERSTCLCLSVYVLPHLPLTPQHARAHSTNTHMHALTHACTQSLHTTRSWVLTTYWVSTAKSFRICANDRDSKSLTCQSPGAGTPGFYKGNFSWGFARTRCECLWQRSQEK